MIFFSRTSLVFFGDAHLFFREQKCIYPLVICYIAIEKTTFRVDFPIEHGDVRSFFVCLPGRVSRDIYGWFPGQLMNPAPGMEQYLR